METPTRNTPQMTLLSGPMGGGKSAVNLAIMSGMAEADMATWGMTRVYSLSKTSRTRRQNNGEYTELANAYEFDVPEKEFERGLASGSLMEVAHHSDDFYASPTPPEGQPTHFEIEVAGVRQIVDSTKPEVTAARQGMRCVYLLQGSMGQLYKQILERPDGVPEEKKLKRIARYPAEILYILEHRLPYGFVMNVAGEPQHAQQAALAYMLGEASVSDTVNARIAHNLAAGAISWLKEKGLTPPSID